MEQRRKMVTILDAKEDLDGFRMLVKEYTDGILQQDAEVAKTLSSQHLEEELRDVEAKYGPPGGRMYVAMVDGQIAGCVALARTDDDYCEIKRLYVRPEFRGRHISRILCDRVIGDARAIGYQYMRLDTFPFMKDAIRLYEKYGFACIPRYNDNPAENAVFMQLAL